MTIEQIKQIEAENETLRAENERLKNLIGLCMKDIKNGTPNLAWIKMNKAINAPEQ